MCAGWSMVSRRGLAILGEGARSLIRWVGEVVSKYEKGRDLLHG